MNLHHLRYFLAVARSGGFTSAAQNLSVTQPTVSNGISELEKSLKIQLFNRHSRHVELTLEGKVMMNYALQIEDTLDELEERLRHHDLGGEGFNFGAIDAAVIYMLPDLLKGFMDDNPRMQLRAQVGPSRQLVDDLILNKSEFALISLPFSHEKIETLSLFHDSMPLIVGRNHIFAKRGRVEMADVIAEPLLLFNTGSVSRQIVDEKLSELGLIPLKVMEMGSPEAMRKLVEVGFAVSFLPLMTVNESVDSGDLCVVEVDGVIFRREIGLAWRRGRYFGSLIRQLIDRIVSSCNKNTELEVMLKQGTGKNNC
ncbi:MAG: LysR family transcriptional regulator [Candidatus Latescibacterota bacterium]|nr:LysR family transcriptional regulator [Candidatus Latescibacterota bacterium]